MTVYLNLNNSTYALQYLIRDTWSTEVCGLNFNDGRFEKAQLVEKFTLVPGAADASKLLFNTVKTAKTRIITTYAMWLSLWEFGIDLEGLRNKTNANEWKDFEVWLHFYEFRLTCNTHASLSKITITSIKSLTSSNIACISISITNRMDLLELITYLHRSRSKGKGTATRYQVQRHSRHTTAWSRASCPISPGHPRSQLRRLPQWSSVQQEQHGCLLVFQFSRRP